MTGAATSGGGDDGKDGTTEPHAPWCMHVAAGTADLKDLDDGTVLRHPDGDTACSGEAYVVDGTLAAWTAQEHRGGPAVLVVDGRAVLTAADDVRALARRLDLMAGVVGL